LLHWLHSIERKNGRSVPEEAKFVALLRDLLSETGLDDSGQLLSMKFMQVNFSEEATIIWGGNAISTLKVILIASHKIVNKGMSGRCRETFETAGRRYTYTEFGSLRSRMDFRF
jgi:hypothetical protein